MFYVLLYIVVNTINLLIFFSALHAPTYCICFMQYPIAYILHMLLNILIRQGEELFLMMFFCFAPHRVDYQAVFIPSVTRMEWSIVRELYTAHSDYNLVLV